jgi:hypothetical protein
MPTLLNMLLYQATWIAAVAGAGAGLWWPGPLVFVLFALWQFGRGPWRRADAVLVAGVGLLGFAIDSAYVQIGLMKFATALPWPGFSPVWMTMLWTSYALALNHSLAFLHARPVLAALLGGIGAPLAYWAAGRGWHALTFGPEPWLTTAATAVIWAALMPLLAALAWRLRVLDGVAAAAQATP